MIEGDDVTLIADINETLAWDDYFTEVAFRCSMHCFQLDFLYAIKWI